MPRRKPIPERRTKAPGENITESQRHTAAIKLRLQPAQRDAIAALATSWDRTLSETVAEAVRMAGDRCRAAYCVDVPSTLGYCRRHYEKVSDTSGT